MPEVIIALATTWTAESFEARDYLVANHAVVLLAFLTGQPFALGIVGHRVDEIEKHSPYTAVALAHTIFSLKTVQRIYTSVEQVHSVTLVKAHILEIAVVFD